MKPLTLPRLRTAAVLASLLTVYGCAAVQETRCAPGEERAVNDVMIFGTAKPVGAGTVTPGEWTEFLRTSVTPRFPQGLTVWQASGQWRGADTTIVHEASFVLSLVHPDDEPSEAAVRAISNEYKSRFSQESVLRVKSHACVSF
jgi:hypothetical protein